MTEIKIVAMNYEQRRLEYFKQQKDRAERSLLHWSKKAAGASYLSLAYEKAGEAADKVAFYSDCIEAFGGKER